MSHSLRDPFIFASGGLSLCGAASAADCEADDVNQARSAELLEFLDAHADTLVNRVVEEQWGYDLALHKFGLPGRRRCEEDNRFHLHYLTGAISAGAPKAFADYCGWAKVVLLRRGIAVEHLERNLRIWRAAIAHAAPERVADVALGYFDLALERLASYPDEPPPITAVTSNALLSRYLDRVLALDAVGAQELIESAATDEASIFEIFVNVLQPAQREVGRLWQINDISVAIEHFATATTSRILHSLSLRFNANTDGATLLGLCPEGEHHCVGLEMVCSLARMKRWDSRFVGANTPMNAAISIARQTRPNVIALSVTTLLALSNIRRLIIALNEASPASSILVGGHAISLVPQLWHTLGADAYAEDAITALGMLDQLRTRPDGHHPA